ncbi:hypothetical protein SNE40_008385 [Patella caerulea]|uniref:Uncharacterized protein n=1 Tax=Patella caerulea TaxID=87958 RepID=A0AAN8JYR7_PATCE
MSIHNVTNNLAYTTYNTYHVNGDEVGVQIGNGNNFQLKNQLQEEVVDLREEVGELKDRVRQLEERMAVLENNNNDTNTEEPEYQMDDEEEDESEEGDINTLNIADLMAVLENNNNDTNTEEPEYQMDDEEEDESEEGDIITLNIADFGTHRTSRSKTVRELEHIIQECRRRYSRKYMYFITHIYSVKQKKDIYYNYNNKDLSLSHYCIGDGDKVYWCPKSV